MGNNSRRQFLIGTLHSLVVALLACVPGTFFNSRKAWSQVRRVTPTNPTVSTVTTIKSAMEQTTPENVIQVLQTSKLVPEDKLAVLAVRQLGADEVRQSLDRFNELFKSVQANAGHDCGIDCGSTCGRDCGSGCGAGCGSQCDGPKISCNGAFCGGSCRVQSSAIGVVDVSGKLGINFQQLNVDTFRRSVTEILHLVR